MKVTFGGWRPAIVLTALVALSAAVSPVLGASRDLAGILVFSALVDDNWELFAWYGDGRNELVRLSGTPFDEKSPTLSHDRKRLSYATSGGELVMRDLRDGEERILRSEEYPGMFDFPSFAPDGNRLVATYFEGGQQDLARLVMVDLVSGEFEDALSQYGPQLWPSWSPDGTRIAYGYGHCSDACGSIIQEPWVVRPGGLGAEQLAITGALSTGFAWSPDQTRLAFVSNQAGDFDIWMLDLAAGELEQLTQGQGADDSPAFSPDGRQLGFVSNRSGPMSIWLLDLQSRALQQFELPGALQKASIKDLEWR